MPETTSQDPLVSLRYDVTLPLETGGARVELTIGNAPQSLQMGFDRDAQAAALVVSDVRALTAGAAMTPDGMGGWTLTSGGGEVRIEYLMPAIIRFAGTVGGSSGGATEVALYIGTDAALIMGPYLFMEPLLFDASTITLHFQAPPAWEIFTPYRKVGDHYEAFRVTSNLIDDFVRRQQIYLGTMRFTASEDIDGTTVALGILASDKSYDVHRSLDSQGAVDAFVNASAMSYRGLTELFDANPFPVYTMYSSYATTFGGGDGYRFSGSRFFGNGQGIWTEPRYDYLAGHMLSSFVSRGDAPIRGDDQVTVAIGEMYYGKEIARRNFDPTPYEGRWLHHYYAYERMWNEPGIADKTDFFAKFQPMFFALLLDHEIRKATDGQKSLDDVFAHLYHSTAAEDQIGLDDIVTATETVTGHDPNPAYQDYIIGRGHMPLAPLVEPFLPSKAGYPALAQEGWPWLLFEGHWEPLFALIEITIHREPHVMAGLLDTYGRLDEFAARLLVHRGSDRLLSAQEIEAALSDVTGADATGFLDRWIGSHGALTTQGFDDWLEDYSAAKAQGNQNVGSPTQDFGGGTNNDQEQNGEFESKRTPSTGGVALTALLAATCLAAPRRAGRHNR